MNRQKRIVVSVILAALFVVAVYAAAMAVKSPHDGPRIIIAKGNLPDYGTTGSGWNIAVMYHFTVYHESRLVGNWTANGLVQAGIVNNTQMSSKNFSALHPIPFADNGSFNVILQPGQYWIGFNLDGSIKQTSVSILITTPIELVP
ncbi:MAG: hypothetical protein KIS30_09850 [Thermoplasmata archaeon]|nr:hypothetical protein [Candidatus Sysuiplasma acidicola]MBX8647037.1 hypothetical protein [Candidatus Sysuiplasma acidicola]